jgi:hypothetical protein
MGVNSSKIFTKVLTGTTLLITSDFGLRSASVVLVSGAGSVTGNLQVNGLTNDPIPLAVGQSVTFGVEGNQILDGLTVDATGGVINIIAKH